MNRPLGLYLHIPFCRQRCHFCAFYLEIYREAAADAFLDALQREVRLYGHDLYGHAGPLTSVYFGGGTPTVLTPDQLAAILATIGQSFTLHPDCEITVEAHPGTVDATDLGKLRDSGVTRISFGAESMHDHELTRVGRPGARAETIAAVSAARAAGFTNINLDLMYGLPGQTVKSWQDTLRVCCDLSPSHLSCYALTVEEGTRFAQDLLRQPGILADDALYLEMDHAAQDLLVQAGYARYEISNYAKPGDECRHNLLYWTQGNYLGLGPSAQSFINGVRFGNIANLAEYKTALAQGNVPVLERVVLTPEEQLRDAVIFGLRLTRGIATSDLRTHGARYGYLEVIGRMRAGNILVEEEDRTRLSGPGRLVADMVAEQLF